MNQKNFSQIGAILFFFLFLFSGFLLNCLLFNSKNLIPILHEGKFEIFNNFDSFLQLREEYGYEINPNDPQFASIIEEKEAEMAKAKKQEKKAQEKLKKDKQAAFLKAEKEEKLKKEKKVEEESS